MDRVYRIQTAAGGRHAIERDARWYWLEGDLFGSYRTGEAIDAPPGLLLPPVAPSKIVAIGLNYQPHAEEMRKQVPDEPLMFLKPSTAAIGSGATIVLPPGVGQVDYESEMAVVIGRAAYRVPARDADRYILGLTCMNDVTARTLQRKDVQYTRAKGFDTFAPLGPCIAVGLDWRALDIEGSVNGVRRQASNTRSMMFDVATLIEFISFVMTLHPGDVISTGTPEGVGPLQPGDVVTVKVHGIGELSNPVGEAR